MKKLISSLIIISNILSVCIFPSVSYSSSSEVRVFVNQNCDNGFYNAQTMNKSTIVESVYLDDARTQGAISFVKSGVTAGGPILEIEFETAQPLVLECRVNLSDTQNGKTHIFLLKSSGGTYSRNLCITSDGALICGKKQTAIGYIPTGTWVSLKAAMDFTANTMDLYVNDDTVYTDISFHREIYDSVVWTLGWVGGTEGGESYGTLLVDDIKAYTSDAPVDLDSVQTILPYTFDTMENGEELLDGNAAFCSQNQKVYYNNSMHTMPNSIIVRNEKMYISTECLKAVFGEDEAAVNSEYIITHESQKYICLEKYAESAGLRCTTDLIREVSLVSQDAPDTESDGWLDMADIMRFNFMTPKEVQTAFETESPGRPRILINSADAARMKSLYGSDSCFTEWADTVITDAESIISADPVVYDEATDSGGILYKSRAVLNRILSLGASYFITGDERYAQRGITEMYSACSFPDWNTYSHYLDAAEMGAAVAIGYDWFYSELDNDQKLYIENKLYRYLLCQSLGIYEGSGVGVSTFWSYSSDNWNAVCSGGTAAAACAVFESYPEVCSKLISYASKAVASMERSAYPDGGWEEGSDYVTYCMKYLSFMFTSMQNTVGTHMNLPLGMYGVVDYMLAIDGQIGCFNFHDAHQTITHTTSDVVSLISRVYDRTDLLTARKMAVDGFGLTPTAIDLLYYVPESEAAEFSIPLDYHAKPIEVFAMRSKFYDKSAVYAAIQGGKGWTGHSHLDGGTFTVDMNGERWATNLGQDSYDLEGYFGSVETRYSYYRNRPESANVYVINPREESYGQNVDANVKIIALASDDDEACAVMDLTEAYSKDAVSAMRGIKLCDNRCSVVIRDEITFNGENSEIYWFMNVPRYASLTQLDANRYMLSKPNGASVELHIETGGIGNQTIELMDCKPLPTSPDPEGQNQNTGLQKLAIHGYSGEECFINVRFTKSEAFNSDEPLKNWKCFEFEAESDGIDFAEMESGQYLVTADMRAKSISEEKRAALIVAHYSGDKLISIDTDFVTLDGLDTRRLNAFAVKGENETLKAIVIDESIRPLDKYVKPE